MNWSILFSKEVNVDDSATTSRHIKILLLLLIDMGLNCIIGLTPLVDNFTHLGGMIYGFLVGLSTMKKLSSDFFGKNKGFIDHLKLVFVRFFGLIVCIIAIIITFAVLAESNGSSIPCDKCRYFSCVPFPPWKEEDDKWWHCDDCGLVTADAISNPSKQIFSVLNLTCPDKQKEVIDISDENISDSREIARKLPSYCRQYCDNLFIA